MESLTLTGNPDCVNPGFDCLPDNPLHLLKEWLDSADRLKIVEPRGLVLSTIDDCGRPSSRVVLMKTVDDTGVIFASSETSQKGKDLEKNPIIAGTLWWRETMQQINFCGSAAKLPAIMSDEIFRERTPEAQARVILCVMRKNYVKLLKNVQKNLKKLRVLKPGMAIISLLNR